MQNNKSKLKILGLIIAGGFIVGMVAFFRFSGMATTALWNISNGGAWMLPLVSIAALIDSINPCAFSILLLTIAFLLSLGKARLGILKIGGFYILGIFTVYILIGLGILQTLHLFNTPHFMAKVGASLLMVLGAINLINEFVPSFPIKLRIPHATHHTMAKLMQDASLPTAFLLGGLVGLCEFPCTGGPYLMILGLLHDQGTYFAGLGYLLLYNVIFVVPLIVMLLIASDKTLLEKLTEWQQQEKSVMRLWGGVAMMILGVIIFLL